MFENEDAIRDMIEAGAQGYVLKRRTLKIEKEYDELENLYIMRKRLHWDEGSTKAICKNHENKSQTYHQLNRK